MNLGNFKRGFKCSHRVSTHTCECGKTFISTLGWDEEMEESVTSDDRTQYTELDIDLIVFEGKEYADYCDCWHERAKKIMAFLASHHTEAGKYLNLERERKIKLANNLEKVNTERHTN